MRQRAISEEDASAALEVFESALTGYSAAHLCLAEVYISGSAPQFGRDFRRAITELTTFIEHEFDAGEDGQGDRALFDAARAVAFLAPSVEANGLAPLAPVLLRLASTISLLQGAALRACLCRLERIDGIGVCTSVALIRDGRQKREQDEGGAPLAPVQLLDRVLGDLAAAQSELATLRVQSEKEQGQLTVLGARCEVEALRADRAERALQVAQAEVAETASLRQDCKQLQQKLEDRAGVRPRTGAAGRQSPLPRAGSLSARPSYGASDFGYTDRLAEDLENVHAMFAARDSPIPAPRQTLQERSYSSALRERNGRPGAAREAYKDFKAQDAADRRSIATDSFRSAGCRVLTPRPLSRGAGENGGDYF
jgi:hypothetical protein